MYSPHTETRARLDLHSYLVAVGHTLEALDAGEHLIGAGAELLLGVAQESRVDGNAEVAPALWKGEWERGKNIRE